MTENFGKGVLAKARVYRERKDREALCVSEVHDVKVVRSDGKNKMNDFRINDYYSRITKYIRQMTDNRRWYRLADMSKEHNVLCGVQVKWSIRSTDGVMRKPHEPYKLECVHGVVNKK